MGAGETPSLFPGKLSPFSSSSSLLSPSLLCLSLSLSLALALSLFCLYLSKLSPTLLLCLHICLCLSLLFSFYHPMSLHCLSLLLALAFSSLFIPSPLPHFPCQPTSLSVFLLLSFLLFLSPFLCHLTSLSLSLSVPSSFSDVFRRREMCR